MIGLKGKAEASMEELDKAGQSLNDEPTSANVSFACLADLDNSKYNLPLRSRKVSVCYIDREKRSQIPSLLRWQALREVMIVPVWSDCIASVATTGKIKFSVNVSEMPCSKDWLLLIYVVCGCIEKVKYLTQ